MLTTQFSQQAAVNLIEAPLRHSRCRHPERHVRKQRGLLPHCFPLGQKLLVTQVSFATRHVQQRRIGPLRQLPRANGGTAFAKLFKVAEAAVQERLGKRANGFGVIRLQHQGIRHALKLELWTPQHAVVVHHDMTVADNVIKRDEIVIEPKQVGLQRVEAIAAHQGLGHSRRAPEHPNKVQFKLCVPNQHSAPKRPQPGSARILECPCPMAGGFRTDQGLGLFNHRRQTRCTHQSAVARFRDIPLQGQRRQQALVELEYVPILPMALDVVRR